MAHSSFQLKSQSITAEIKAAGAGAGAAAAHTASICKKQVDECHCSAPSPTLYNPGHHAERLGVEDGSCPQLGKVFPQSLNTTKIIPHRPISQVVLASVKLIININHHDSGVSIPQAHLSSGSGFGQGQAHKHCHDSSL